MSTDITIAIIALFGTTLGTFGGIIASSKLTAYRIEQLEEKVNKHNNVIARTYELEAQGRLYSSRLEMFESRLQGRRDNDNI